MIAKNQAGRGRSVQEPRTVFGLLARLVAHKERSRVLREGIDGEDTTILVQDECPPSLAPAAGGKLAVHL